MEQLQQDNQLLKDEVLHLDCFCLLLNDVLCRSSCNYLLNTYVVVMIVLLVSDVTASISHGVPQSHDM